MAELTLDEVTKVFADNDGDGIVAVDEVSIDLDDGNFLVLVGPSGCGKSTTLRMIAGLESITGGEIRLGGQRINGKSAKDRNIAMVFQSYALYPHMTVRQNMSFGLEESTDLPDGEIATRVEDAAETMGIDDLLDRKPRELSGGQQQRVALGRAIVRDPSVFLMDEPLSNLDAKLRAQMRTELQRLQEDLGVTTVYVTHDQTEAMTMGDRIAVLNDGQLQQVGSPLDCYHKPANVFVAGFIGEPSMNFFDVERQGTQLIGDRIEYPISGELADEFGDTTDLVLGVRPESVDLVAEAETQHDFDVTVDVVEPMGDENVVHLQPQQVTDESDSFVATIDGMRHVEEGQSVVVRIPQDVIHIFDRETGEAIRNRRLDTVDSFVASR